MHYGCVCVYTCIHTLPHLYLSDGADSYLLKSASNIENRHTKISKRVDASQKGFVRFKGLLLSMLRFRCKPTKGQNKPKRHPQR